MIRLICTIAVILGTSLAISGAAFAEDELRPSAVVPAHGQSQKWVIELADSLKKDAGELVTMDPVQANAEAVSLLQKTLKPLLDIQRDPKIMQLEKPERIQELLSGELKNAPGLRKAMSYLLYKNADWQVLAREMPVSTAAKIHELKQKVARELLVFADVDALGQKALTDRWLRIIPDPRILESPTRPSVDLFYELSDPDQRSELWKELNKRVLVPTRGLGLGQSFSDEEKKVLEFARYLAPHLAAGGYDDLILLSQIQSKLEVPVLTDRETRALLKRYALLNQLSGDHRYVKGALERALRSVTSDDPQIYNEIATVFTAQAERNPKEADHYQRLIAEMNTRKDIRATFAARERWEQSVRNPKCPLLFHDL